MKSVTLILLTPVLFKASIDVIFVDKSSHLEYKYTPNPKGWIDLNRPLQLLTYLFWNGETDSIAFDTSEILHFKGFQNVF